MNVASIHGNNSAFAGLADMNAIRHNNKQAHPAIESYLDRIKEALNKEKEQKE